MKKLLIALLLLALPVNAQTVGIIDGATPIVGGSTGQVVSKAANGTVSMISVPGAASPVFTGTVSTSGATTTSPGFESSITGDAFARVAIGLNSTDVSRVSFGPGNAARDLFLQRAGAANLRIGSVDAAAPIAQTVSVQNVLTGTSNIAGANLTIAASRGTGTGAGGSIILQTAPATSTGSTQNPLQNTFTFNNQQLAIASGTITTSVPALNISQTWNGSGITFTGIFGNFVATAAAANSKLIDLQAGGVTQFSVTRAGGMVLTGNISGPVGNTVTYGSATWTNVPSDAALTTNTLCKSTADNTMRVGSGTAGICLGTSSARFKHDIAGLRVSGLDSISALHPVSYKYNPGYGDGNELYGFVAEEVNTVLPTLVGKDAAGVPNTLDMLGMIPVLVLAIQELQAEVKALKGITP